MGLIFFYPHTIQKKVQLSENYITINNHDS